MKLHKENQKILQRIVEQKPSISIDNFKKWEQYQQQLVKNINNQAKSTIHGYPARGSDSIRMSRADTSKALDSSRSVTQRLY